MSLACDSTGPSPWAQTLQDPAPFTGDGFRVVLPAWWPESPHFSSRPGSCVSFSYMLMGYFFLLSFSPKPGNNILGVRGRGERKSRGQKLATATGAVICRRNPQDSFSTKRLHRKSCPANDKGEMESLPHQLLYSGRRSPHVLACALLATTHSGQAAGFPF